MAAPQGVNVVGEYWFPTDDPSVVAIVEAEDTAAVAAIRLAWDDLFDIAAFPIVTAEEGLERLRRMMPAQGDKASRGLLFEEGPASLAHLGPSSLSLTHSTS